MIINLFVVYCPGRELVSDSEDVLTNLLLFLGAIT